MLALVDVASYRVTLPSSNARRYSFSSSSPYRVSDVDHVVRILWAHPVWCVPGLSESTKYHPRRDHRLGFPHVRQQPRRVLCQRRHIPILPRTPLVARTHSRKMPLTTRCQWSSRIEPLVRCCCAAAMSLLAGKSVTTCSRTHPPERSLVLESEKRHLTFGTTPLSVPWAPRLSGFWRSICLSVPPEDWWALNDEVNWEKVVTYLGLELRYLSH